MRDTVEVFNCEDDCELPVEDIAGEGGARNGSLCEGSPGD